MHLAETCLCVCVCLDLCGFWCVELAIEHVGIECILHAPVAYFQVADFLRQDLLEGGWSWKNHQRIPGAAKDQDPVLTERLWVMRLRRFSSRSSSWTLGQKMWKDLSWNSWKICFCTRILENCARRPHGHVHLLFGPHSVTLPSLHFKQLPESWLINTPCGLYKPFRPWGFWIWVRF